MQIKFQILFLVFYLGVNNKITLPTNQGREGFVYPRTLSFNVNFQSELEPHCEIVIPDGYLSKPAFYQDFVEFSKVSAGRMRKS